jgi:uncharacterized membrane protein
MQSNVRRVELDRLTEFYALDASKVDAMLDLAVARPSQNEAVVFLARCLRIAGVLSLAASVVFFIAANWSKLAVFGRFGLLELLLVAATVLAYLKPPPQFAGRAALFLAFMTTGALLALFGQTYQTGADVYELFLTWALLGLPFAVLARWSVASAAWVLILNAALMLFCGWNPTGGFLWMIFGGAHFQPAHLLMGAAWLNIALWFVFDFFPDGAVPAWVRRLILSCAFAFATWGAVLAIFSGEGSFDFQRTHTDVLAMLVLAAAMVTVSLLALRNRDDIYPLAVIMGTFIIVSTVWIAKSLEFQHEGSFLLLAVWLIGTSTAGGRVLMVLVRRWRTERPS